MKPVEAYECSDGALFTDERDAKAHENDLLGEELDGLLKLFEFDGNHVTRNDEYRALMRVLNKRKELRKAITAILKILDHTEDTP